MENIWSQLAFFPLFLAFSILWTSCLSDTGIIAVGWLKLANNKVFGVLLVFACSLMLCIVWGALLGLPQPKIHDEFSYLLSGSTFASGRISNPMHPMWKHFETMHVLVSPTYASKYPAGQGLVLAFGMILGSPIIGVWLCLSCACAATHWMLRAWTKPLWAFVGSAIATFVLCTSAYPDVTVQQPAYWSQSFWGGGVAALGGALLFGGLRWFAHVNNCSSVLALSFGIAILFLCRPFEGLIITVPSVVAFSVVWYRRKRRRDLRIENCSQLDRIRHSMSLSIFLILLTATFVFMAVQNKAITGNPLQLPYMMYSNQYSLSPLTLLQPPKETAARYLSGERVPDTIREFHFGWEASLFSIQQSPNGYLRQKGRQFFGLWKFFFGPLLSIPILAFLASPKSKWAYFSLIVGSAPMIVAVCTPWLHPHYMAPIACLVFLWAAEGLRCLSKLFRNMIGILRGRFPRIPAELSVSATLASTILLLVAAEVTGSLVDASSRQNHSSWHLLRAKIVKKLRDTPGKHLVIVRYELGHSPHSEWIYNGADIDDSKIVWARDLGDNAELLEYFSSRAVWTLEADAPKLSLQRLVRN